jgi:hypothetical protein
MAANAEGLGLLGLRRDGTDAALDVAMPALHRLLEIARRHGPPTRLRERLLFWSYAGSLNLLCDVFIPDAATKSALLVVSAAREGESARSEAPGPQAPLPRVSSDEAATLREIARRIRAGHAGLSAQGG